MEQCYENIRKESTKQVRDKMYTARLSLSKIQAGKVMKVTDGKNCEHVYIIQILSIFAHVRCGIGHDVSREARMRGELGLPESSNSGPVKATYPLPRRVHRAGTTLSEQYLKSL